MSQLSNQETEISDQSLDLSDPLTSEPPAKKQKTKQPIQHKAFCFTWHIKKEEVEACRKILIACFEKMCVEYCFQLEISPSTFSPHFQGCVFAKKKMRYTQFGLSKRIHWEKMLGNRNQNLLYCSKDDTRCPEEGSGPWYSPFCKPPRQLQLEKMDKKFQLMIMELIAKEPDKRTIHWFYSHMGGVGKTETVRYLVEKHAACLLSGKGADVRNGLLTWVDQKSYPDIVCVDIPRSHLDYVSYEALENIKNMLFYSGKYEGGMVNGPPCHLLVFANEAPKAGALSSDRVVEYFIGESEEDDEIKFPDKDGHVFII